MWDFLLCSFNVPLQPVSSLLSIVYYGHTDVEVSDILPQGVTEPPVEAHDLICFTRTINFFYWMSLAQVGMFCWYRCYMLRKWEYWVLEEVKLSKWVGEKCRGVYNEMGFFQSAVATMFEIILPYSRKMAVCHSKGEVIVFSLVLKLQWRNDLLFETWMK